MTATRDIRPTPAFRTIANSAASGTVLKPILQGYLYEADFPGEFSVLFKKEEHIRKPDGWFHPSTHPLWPARMLWHYLNDPDLMIPEDMEYMSTLSVTIGKAMHSFIQMCLTDAGVLMAPAQLIAEGIQCDENGEPYLVDEEVGSRGHTDGILNLHIPTHPRITRQNFEFKTSNERKMSKIDDLDLEAFKATWPDYYAQQQEYLRMSGYLLSVVLFLSLGYPWGIKEFHIPYDPFFATAVRDKYVMVRQATEPPMPCCAPRSSEAKSCPARGACEIGRMR